MTEEQQLEALKAKMSDSQRREMAEIVAAEVRRRDQLRQSGGSPAARPTGAPAPRPTGVRPAAKSGVRSSGLSQGLSGQALGEMYGDLQQRLVEMRKRKIEEKTAQLDAMKRAPSRSAAPRGRRAGGSLLTSGAMKSSLLFAVIVGLGIAKVAIHSTDGHTASASEPTKAESGPKLGMLAMPTESNPAEGAVLPVKGTDQSGLTPATGDAHPGGITPGGKGEWSESEKQLLLELDTRRVELEKRREGLDQREAELRNQAQALADRLAELKSLTARLGQVRKEKNQQYDARMEQLANVYASMAPNEAAPLVAKLDEETALALLKKMPSKRMGQILSGMEADRAVRLTKDLSERISSEDVPAQ